MFRTGGADCRSSPKGTAEGGGTAAGSALLAGYSRRVAGDREGVACDYSA